MLTASGATIALAAATTRSIGAPIAAPALAASTSGCSGSRAPAPGTSRSDAPRACAACSSAAQSIVRSSWASDCDAGPATDFRITGSPASGPGTFGARAGVGCKARRDTRIFGTACPEAIAHDQARAVCQTSAFPRSGCSARKRLYNSSESIRSTCRRFNATQKRLLNVIGLRIRRVSGDGRIRHHNCCVKTDCQHRQYFPRSPISMPRNNGFHFALLISWIVARPVLNCQAASVMPRLQPPFPFCVSQVIWDIGHQPFVNQRNAESEGISPWTDCLRAM